MRVKSLTEADRHRVEDSIRRPYLHGEQSLKWMVGIVRSSSFRGEALASIIDRIDQLFPTDEAGKKKLRDLREELMRAGFL